MSLRLSESFAWCNFANSVFKSIAGSGFFGGSGGSPTLTGSIDAGPVAGTFGKTFKIADGASDFFGNTGWFQGYDMGATAVKWIVGIWIKPHAITSRQTFAGLVSHEPPNNIGALMFHLNAAGKLELNAQAANIRMNALHGTVTVTSAATIPMDAWTHISVRVDFTPGANNGSIKLWINGVLDTDAELLTLTLGTNPSQFWLVWQNTGAAQIEVSQILVYDTNGSVNNTNISPRAYIKTFFPVSDVSNGGWTPLVAGPNYAMVNSAIGPSSGAYVSLPSLAFPDELFGIAPLTSSDQNLAIAANIAVLQSGPSTLQALLKQGATKYLLGSSITSPATPLIYQAIAENNPATGAPWKDSDVSADAWGFRGLTGTGEEVRQFFIEKVVTSGLGSYSY